MQMFKSKIEEGDVVREHTVHVCESIESNCRQNFKRNFKILFLKGDDLLFKNQHLNF